MVLEYSINNRAQGTEHRVQSTVHSVEDAAGSTTLYPLCSIPHAPMLPSLTSTTHHYLLLPLTTPHYPPRYATGMASGICSPPSLSPYYVYVPVASNAQKDHRHIHPHALRLAACNSLLLEAICTPRRPEGEATHARPEGTHAHALGECTVRGREGDVGEAQMDRLG
jgi:hypothetical protein